jgi:hypothetical protein
MRQAVFFLNVFVTANYTYPNFHESLFEVSFVFTPLGSVIINNETRSCG